MPKRRLPQRPDVDHLRREAKKLLVDFRQGEPSAADDFRNYHPGVDPTSAKLNDAQLALARSYRFPSWPRLLIGAELCLAIDDNDLERIATIVRQHPQVLDEGTRGFDTCASWGAPLAYAEYFDRPGAAALLAELSGTDPATARQRSVQHGLDQLAEWFLDQDGRPAGPGVVMHPCETLNADGLAFLLERGAPLADEKGDRSAPVAMILQTYSRNPQGRRRCLEICAEHGAKLPDTPVMAFHRGRIDLLERHLARDPGLLDRRFSYGEIYPAALGCADESHGGGLHGTPLRGSTLLHLCGDFGATDVSAWLLEAGADANAPAAIDAAGFGGHTPLFNTIVTLALSQGDVIARRLLDAGADSNARASLRAQLKYVPDESTHEYRDVTPVEWGQKFHRRSMVNRSALRLVAAVACK